MLRHTLATLAYRLQQALLDSPDGFAEYRASESLRTPVEILAHMGDLMDWALTLTEGEHVWREAAPLPRRVDAYGSDCAVAADLWNAGEAEELLSGGDCGFKRLKISFSAICIRRGVGAEQLRTQYTILTARPRQAGNEKAAPHRPGEVSNLK